MRFPQIKVGTGGEMVFCCDLYDPLTTAYELEDMCDSVKRKEFLEIIRTNPYIWLCALLNPCDFSVNNVRYEVG
jgi:hypothetical protein